MGEDLEKDSGVDPARDTDQQRFIAREEISIRDQLRHRGSEIGHRRMLRSAAKQSSRPSASGLGACLKTTRGAAARNFGGGLGGESGASPKRAVTDEPTTSTFKRPVARRVFRQMGGWLRCSSVEDPQGVFSFVTPRHPPICRKTAPLVVFRQALKKSQWRDAFSQDGRAFGSEPLLKHPSINRSEIHGVGQVAIQ